MIDTSNRAACADCGKPIYRTAPGTGYDWAHVSQRDLMACKGESMTRPQPPMTERGTQPEPTAP